MKLAIVVVFAMLPVLAQSVCAEEPEPGWITAEKLAALKGIGIDPTNDLEAKGNYHWRYRARRPLAIDVYSCPIGSMVTLSRNIFLIVPPEKAACSNSKGGDVRALKLLPNGSAEPIS